MNDTVSEDVKLDEAGVRAAVRGYGNLSGIGALHQEKLEAALRAYLAATKPPLAGEVTRINMALLNQLTDWFNRLPGESLGKTHFDALIAIVTASPEGERGLTLKLSALRAKSSATWFGMGSFPTKSGQPPITLATTCCRSSWVVRSPHPVPRRIPMPSEAELSAERIALVALIAERDGSEFDGEIHLSSEEGERIRAALSAASAVRSEPVAWLAKARVGGGQMVNTAKGSLLEEASALYDRDSFGGFDLIPLYTSPVQTREVAAFERELAEGVLNRLGVLTVGTCSCNTMTRELKDHAETCRYRIAAEAFDLARALLSQPEPKGDKT
jgi:hypothetical protein